MKTILSVVAGIVLLHVVLGAITPCTFKIPPFATGGSENGYCYALFNESKTYIDSNSTCTKFGGILASVHSDKENALIVSLMKTAGYGGEAWLGLNDELHENDFVWEDGSLLSYQNWADKEGPRNGVQHEWEDCATISSSDGKWRDYKCRGWIGSLLARKSEYVCQFKE